MTVEKLTKPSLMEVSLTADLLKTQQQAMTAVGTQATQVAVIGNDIEHIKNDLIEIKASFRVITESFITKAEFLPVKNLVYGMVGFTLLAVLGAVLALVIIQIP